MKKSFLLLILLSAVCVSTNAFSACVKKPGFKCPNIKCPFGTILGDDGVCYACDTPETIDVTCANEILYPSCSNRVAIKVPCSTISIFCSSTTCSDGFFMGDDGKCHSCDDEADVEINCIGIEAADKICPNRINYENGHGYRNSCLCKKGYEKREAQSYTSLPAFECCNAENDCILYGGFYID